MLFDRIRNRRERERLLRFMLSQYPIRATKVRTTPECFEVYTDQGVMALHWYEGKPEELWLAYIVFDQLQSSSVMNVVHWYETVHNQPYLRVEGETFYLTSWFEVDQATTQGITPDRVVETLAKLHTVSREVIFAQDFADTLPDPVPLPTVWFEQLTELEQYLQSLEDLDYRGAFEEQLLQFGRRLLQQGQQALRLLGQVDYPSDVRDGMTLEYAGFSLSNLRRVDDRVYYIPRHSSYRWGWRIVNLTEFILNASAKDEDLQMLLDHYLSIASLKNWELAALPAVMLFPSQEVGFVMQYQETANDDNQKLELLSQQLGRRKELSLGLNDLVEALVDRASNIIVVNPADFRFDVEEGEQMEEYKKDQQPEDTVEKPEDDHDRLAQGQENIPAKEENQLSERNGPVDEDYEQDEESTAEEQGSEQFSDEDTEAPVTELSAEDQAVDELEGEESPPEPMEEQEEDQLLEHEAKEEDQSAQADQLAELQAKAQKYSQQYKKLITWGPFPEPISKKDQPQ